LFAGFGFTSGKVTVNIGGTPCMVTNRSHDVVYCTTEAFARAVTGNISAVLE